MAAALFFLSHTWKLQQSVIFSRGINRVFWQKVVNRGHKNANMLFLIKYNTILTFLLATFACS